MEIEQKDINEYTKKEFLAMPIFGQDELFNAVTIVPEKRIHESGFRCMRFILERECKIVGCVGGYSDVVYPNGIGNIGYKFDTIAYRRGLVPYINLRMDCLKKSRCIRLCLSGLYRCEDMILSDFCFYKVEADDAKDD